MKISNMDASNFRLHGNSVDGRGLSAQDIRGKLGLNNVTFSVSKVGENNTNKDNDDVVEISARAKSNAVYMGDNKSTQTEQTGAGNLLAASESELAAKGLRLDTYYSMLFQLDVQEANKLFGTSHSINSSGLPETTEQTVARYNELREQIMREFSHDTGLLEDHLSALDKSLEYRLISNNATTVLSLYLENFINSTTTKEEYTEEAFHPLARHKDFNFDEFKANAREMMIRFAQEYTQQLKDNSGNFSNAWDTTLKIMSEIQTTSVNKLSFNDLMILDETNPGRLFDFGNMTRKQAIAAHGNMYESFLNHDGLSDYLRNALGVGTESN